MKQRVKNIDKNKEQASLQEPNARKMHVEKAMFRRGSFTEIMRKILQYCKTQRTYSEAEAEIASYPEFHYVDQSQACIIDILVFAGGLNKYELDSQGKIITEKKKQGLSEDDLDEMVCSFSLETTDAGAAAIEGMNPKNRMRALFESEPERTHIYRQILRLCASPKSFKELESSLLNMPNMPALASQNKLSSLSVFPSALIAKLESAGGLLWDEAWVLTSAGKSFI